MSFLCAERVGEDVDFGNHSSSQALQGIDCLKAVSRQIEMKKLRTVGDDDFQSLTKLIVAQIEFDEIRKLRKTFQRFETGVDNAKRLKKNFK